MSLKLRRDPVSVPATEDRELTTSAEALTLVLDALCREQEHLLELCEAHERAIRAADSSEMARVSAERGRVVGQIGALEERRRVCVRPWAAQRVATVAAMAAWLPAEVSEPLLRAATTLRGLIVRVRERHGAIADLSRRVGDHLSGVTRAVARAASGHGGYSRFGQAVGAAGPVSTLDVRR
ncbi:MAG: flagellar export chaperone FlgN [Planctomycetota bacterium]